MVLQKRLDYGFIGYQVPPTPRAARSVRRRCLFKRKADDSQMCAFDLLATVAGKLLLEGESSSPSVDTFSGKEQPVLVQDSVRQEEKNGYKPLEEISFGRDCYERNFLFTNFVPENPSSGFCLNEFESAKNDAISRPASGLATPKCLEKVGSAENLVTKDCKLRLGIFAPSVHHDIPCSNDESVDENRKHIKLESAITKNSSLTKGDEMHNLWRLEACDRKPSGIVSSVDSVNIRFCRDHSPCGSAPVDRDNVKLVDRDDDDNLSGFTEPSTRIKTVRPSQYVQNSKVRKFLACKPRKLSPNVKDDELYNANTERCNHLNKKRSIKSQRSLRDYPFKKRKFYDSSSRSNSDEDFSSDGMCSIPENGTYNGALDFRERVIRTPTSAAREHAFFKQRNSQVKLKIKSFRVPELFIEISETATVGSLKKTVLEAVNAVLGDGLRIGVLLQGKKIRDDNQTLLQTGISRDKKTDCLGFTLEPSHSQAQPQDSLSQLRYDNPQPLARYPPNTSNTRSSIQIGDPNTPPDLTRTDFNNFVESDNDSALSRPNMTLQIADALSKALVPVPTMEPNALSVVPLRKSKRSDSAQRRIRRPFTVSEVEALVQAVEKLGTGRWRDVKMRAFDTAKHRTYVDLKDKWKTLVHTARISPQQRRGEPVPQDLLDRVLTAHAYWSQQQAKQHLKSSSLLAFFSEKVHCRNT